MTLSSGSRLGPYEILAPLGAGGMGEVWRARDSRLVREVAIKVLPAQLSSDASRLKRFEKEARSASALNHPNIVTIYDIGSEGGVSFIAMEKVDGETLRKALAGGALPIKRLLSIGTQIAEGLAKAHEAGIVHRDLKPENLMVTKDGLLKILDFGLAKLSYVESGEGESHLPTMTGTSPGMVVGTAGYMSPEQASGERVDSRSDQFALGSILYEMATGKRAFLKKTAVDTLGAILNEEPPSVASLNPHVPAPIRWIVERCLAKDPEARYVSTRDLAREIASVSAHLSEAVVSGAIPAGIPRQSPWRLVLAALLLGIAVFAGTRLTRSKTQPPRFQQVTFQKATIQTATFAPDGQTIVYTARRPDGKFELLQTRPGSHGSRALGIFGATVTSISASGEMALVRESDGALLTAPIGGGEPRPRDEGVNWADWAPDGKSLAVMRSKGSSPKRLEYPIGTLLCEPAGGGGRISVSPQGDRVAFREGARISVVDRRRVKTVLAQNGLEFAWSPDGKEVWFTRITEGSTHLFAVTLSGRERLLTSVPGDFTFYDVSREGRALFERSFYQSQVFGRFPGDEHEHGYNWLDATQAMDLSADGKTLLFVELFAANSGMSYIRKTDGSAAIPLADGNCLALSPDGKWAVCRAEWMSSSLQLVSTAGETRHLPTGGLEFQGPPGVRPVWLPDGKRFAFNANAPGRPSRIYVQSIEGSAPTPVSPEGTTTALLLKTASPDGRFVVGVQGEVAALYPLDQGPAVPIAGILPGDSPMQWTADGRSLYIWREDAPGKIWLLDLVNGKRRLFRELSPADAWVGHGGGLANFCITPDGSYYAGTYWNFLADLFVLDGVK